MAYDAMPKAKDERRLEGGQAQNASSVVPSPGYKGSHELWWDQVAPQPAQRI